MKIKYFRFLAFLFPLSFLVLMLFYQDNFYLLLSAITFIFSVLFALPNLFSTKKISLFKNKKILSHSNHKANLDFSKNFKISFKDRAVLIFIILSTVLFIGDFTYSGIYLSQVIQNINNIFIEYYFSQFINLKQTWIYLAPLLLVLTVVGVKLRHTGSGYNFLGDFTKRNFIKYLAYGCGTLFISFLISFLTVFIVGILQLNSASFELKQNPSGAGMLSDKNAINNKLKSMTTLPKIIGVNGDETNAILTAVIDTNINNKNLYQQKILNDIPHFFLMPLNINKPVVMVNNTLIISNIDKDTMQTISPALAHLLLANYFKNHVWKNDPVISILNRQQYLAYRQKEIDQQVAALQSLEQKVDGELSSLESDASSDQSQISSDQNDISDAQSEESAAYNNCTSASYTDFFTGTVYTYTQSYCDSVKGQYEAAISQGQQEINQLSGELDYTDGQITETKNALAALEGYEQSVNSEKDSTPDELGLFESPNQVRVVLDSTSPQGIDDFLETLVHENLHYQSFVATDRCFHFSTGDGTCDVISYDSFWEEGLTEYFARKVIDYDLGVHVNQGYPLIVKIVSQIATKIPESQLQQIYFTKDESGLEAALDSTYGNTFYKDSEVYFETLSYLPDDQQLKIANNIMTRIGGQQLSMNDLYSTDFQQ